MLPDSVRDLIVDLPPGFVGAPTAVGECTPAQFTLQSCPASSQVGRMDIGIAPIGGAKFLVINTGVFNLSHPRGVISDLAFVVAGNPVHIKVSLDPANRYAITSEVPNINETLPPYNNVLTLWGIPADHSHDPEGCNASSLATRRECPTDATPKPFLSLPSQCESAQHLPSAPLRLLGAPRCLRL